MSLDQDLKHALERHALEQDPTPTAWAGVEAKVRRAHRRVSAAAVATTIAVIAAASLTIPRLLSDDAEAPFANDGLVDPRASASPLPTKPATDPSPGRGVVVMPEEFVVLDDGRIELRSTATGKLVRVLLERDPSVRRHGLVRNGSVTYFVEEPAEGADDGCKMQIFSVEEVQVGVGVDEVGVNILTVARGSDVAFSPDGAWMAYVGLGDAPNCRQGGIVLRNLESEQERTWAWKAYDEAYVPEFTSVHSLRWHPDSEHLLFGITTGDPAFEYFLLDIFQGEDILDARELNVDGAAQPGAALFDPAFTQAPDRFMVIRQFTHEGPKPQNFLWIDLETGRVLERVLQTPLQVNDFELDVSGTYMIFTVTIFPEDGEGGGRPETYLWDGEGEPRKIADAGGEIEW